jgi:ribosome-associated heat shock protein Hsp15
VRFDKLLWFLRFTKTRSLAQGLAEGGHVRINGRRIERSAQRVTEGDILVLPLGAGVLVIEILTLPSRRGPPAEAASCYRVLDGQAANPIAAPATPIDLPLPEHQGDTPP